MPLAPATAQFAGAGLPLPIIADPPQNDTHRPLGISGRNQQDQKSYCSVSARYDSSSSL